MESVEKPSAVDPGSIVVDPELREAVDNFLKGVRDPEAMLRAAERMDRMREQLPRTDNLAVELIREGRDEE
jgi:hypothetical protein